MIQKIRNTIYGKKQKQTKKKRERIKGLINISVPKQFEFSGYFLVSRALQG